MLLAMQYYAPYLALELLKQDYTPGAIAFIYGIPAIVYAICMVYLPDIVYRYHFRAFIIMGYIAMGVAALLVGGLIKFDGEWKLNYVWSVLGLILMGISAAMISVPVFPELIESIEVVEKFQDMFDEDYLEEFISNLFIYFQSVGELIGPIINAIIIQYHGFATAQWILFFYLMANLVIYFIFCADRTICEPLPEEELDNNFDLVNQNKFSKKATQRLH